MPSSKALGRRIADAILAKKDGAEKWNAVRLRVLERNALLAILTCKGTHFYRKIK
jgi:hypothetical protein